MKYPEEREPDGPAIDDNPYRPDTLQRLIPKPPEPYETFDPKYMIYDSIEMDFKI